MIDNQTLSLADLNTHDATPIQRGNERRYLCPLCGDAKPRDNGHRSLCANIQTGLWNCKRCKANGKLSDYWEQPSPSPHISKRARSRRELTKRFAFSGVVPPSASLSTCLPSDLAPSDFDWRKAWELAQPVPSAAELAALGLDRTLSEGARYILGRSISLDTARGSGTRICRNWAGGRAVLFPQHNFDRQLVAVQGRYLQPREGQPKSRTYGSAKNGVFSVLDALTNPNLLLCEGPFDALAFGEAGFPAVALIGTALPPWIHRVAAFKNVWLASDADTTGDEVVDSWGVEVAPFATLYKRLRPPSRKDWNEELQVLGVNGLAAWLAQYIRPIPQLLEPPRTYREILRPDLRQLLELEPLSADPPEACPHPRFMWVRDLGCWMDGDVIVSTVATTEMRDRYYAACRESPVLAAELAKRASADEDVQVFIRALKQGRKSLGPQATAHEIHTFARAIILLDLGQDPAGE